MLIRAASRQNPESVYVNGRLEQEAGGVNKVVNAGTLGHPVIAASVLELTVDFLGTIMLKNQTAEVARRKGEQERCGKLYIT